MNRKWAVAFWNINAQRMGLIGPLINRFSIRLIVTGEAMPLERIEALFSKLPENRVYSMLNDVIFLRVICFVDPFP